MRNINRTNDNGHYIIDKDNNRIVLIEYRESKSGNVTVLKKEICTYIEVTEQVISDEDIYYRVEYSNKQDGISHRYLSPSDFNIEGKLNPILTSILNSGLIINPNCKKYFSEYLIESSKNVEKTRVGTTEVGWLPNGEFMGCGFQTEKDIIYTGSIEGFKFERAGNEKEYLDLMAQVYIDNPLVFAVNSYQASGFIQHILANESNQILSMVGNSSKGKTNAAKTGLSLFTSPSNFIGFSSSKGVLYNCLETYNHHTMYVDEIGESNLRPEERASLVYYLCNGKPKKRLSRNALTAEYSVDMKSKMCRYTCLISGELGFLSKCNVAGTGLDVRYIEIRFNKRQLWDSITTQAQAEAHEYFISKNYGWLTEPFINKIKNETERIRNLYYEKLESVRDEAENSSSIVKRKLRILAYTYVTSLIISEILYSDKSEEFHKTIADNAMQAFKAVVFDDIENEEFDKYKEALSHINDKVLGHFQDLDSLANQTLFTNNEKLGYYKKEVKYREYQVITSSFSTLCDILDVDEKLFLDYLQENKMLIHDEGKKTKKIKRDGIRARYYVFRIQNDFFDDEKKQEQEEDIDIDDKAWQVDENEPTPWG